MDESVTNEMLWTDAPQKRVVIVHSDNQIRSTQKGYTDWQASDRIKILGILHFLKPQKQTLAKCQLFSRATCKY